MIGLTIDHDPMAGDGAASAAVVVAQRQIGSVLLVAQSGLGTNSIRTRLR
jgi:hypothetical protein